MSAVRLARLRRITHVKPEISLTITSFFLATILTPADPFTINAADKGNYGYIRLRSNLLWEEISSQTRPASGRYVTLGLSSPAISRRRIEDRIQYTPVISARYYMALQISCSPLSPQA